MGICRRLKAGIKNGWKIAGEPAFFEDARPRKGFLRRFWDCARVGLVDGEPFVDYNCFGADRKGVRPFDFVRYPSDMMHRIYARNDQLDHEGSEILEDKCAFARRMAATGLPVARTIAEGDENGNLTADGVPIAWPQLEARLRACADGFFFKRPSLWGGKGVVFVKFDGASFVTSEGPLDIVAAVRGGACLFQMPVRQSAEMAALNATSVNTLRIVTIRYGDRFELMLPSVVRVGRAGACADNIGSGGMAIGVKEDGRLCDWALARDANYQHVMYARHPDHGYRFDGRMIVGYRSAVELALSAHRFFPRLLAVGWDVALTEEGPVLIEGNAKFGVELNEIVHRQPAGPAFEAARRRDK